MPSGTSPQRSSVAPAGQRTSARSGLATAEATLRRRQVFGLLLLAGLILLYVLVRAPWYSLFPPGWWRF